MKSLWKNTAEKPSFYSLNKDIKTGILIVGGGLTGILCAHMLQKEGMDYTLIEANEICSGITKNTTAKITVQHGLIYDEIIKKYGVKTAKDYYTANNNAIIKYRKLCNELGCKLETKDACVYTTYDISKIKSEINAYKAIGVAVNFTTETPLPINVSGAVKLKNQVQIHPLDFLYALSKNLNIYEHTKLVNLTSDTAETTGGKIHYNKVIIATHFPILNKHGSYFLKMYQHRSYVIALKNAQNVNGMYVDADIKGLSFRNYGDYLLIGGGSHRTGKKGGNWRELVDFAKKYYPHATIEYKWATQDCMTLDGMAYIGNYSRHTPNLYVATGFNKWGFTTAMVAAEILCDMVQGKENRYSYIFSPSDRKSVV